MIKESHVAGPVWRLRDRTYIQNCVACGVRLGTGMDERGFYRLGETIYTAEPTPHSALSWQSDLQDRGVDLGSCENRILDTSLDRYRPHDYERMLHYRQRQITHMGQDLARLREQIEVLEEFLGVQEEGLQFIHDIDKYRAAVATLLANK